MGGFKICFWQLTHLSNRSTVGGCIGAYSGTMIELCKYEIILISVAQNKLEFTTINSSFHR